MHAALAWHQHQRRPHGTPLTCLEPRTGWQVAGSVRQKPRASFSPQGAGGRIQSCSEMAPSSQSRSASTSSLHAEPEQSWGKGRESDMTLFLRTAKLSSQTTAAAPKPQMLKGDEGHVGAGCHMPWPSSGFSCRPPGHRAAVSWVQRSTRGGCAMLTGMPVDMRANHRGGRVLKSAIRAQLSSSGIHLGRGGCRFFGPFLSSPPTPRSPEHSSRLWSSETVSSSQEGPGPRGASLLPIHHPYQRSLAVRRSLAAKPAWPEAGGEMEGAARTETGRAHWSDKQHYKQKQLSSAGTSKPPGLKIYVAEECSTMGQLSGVPEAGGVSGLGSWVTWMRREQVSGLWQGLSTRACVQHQHWRCQGERGCAGRGASRRGPSLPGASSRTVGPRIWEDVPRINSCTTPKCHSHPLLLLCFLLPAQGADFFPALATYHLPHTAHPCSRRKLKAFPGASGS